MAAWRIGWRAAPLSGQWLAAPPLPPPELPVLSLGPELPQAASAAAPAAPAVRPRKFRREIGLLSTLNSELDMPRRRGEWIVVDWWVALVTQPATFDLWSQVNDRFR